jgi:hypothetical protein
MPDVGLLPENIHLHFRKTQVLPFHLPNHCRLNATMS